MSHITVDRVLETTTTTGTSDLALGGAVSSYRAFSSAMVNGDTCHYMVAEVDSTGRPIGAWETGRGTYQTGGVLQRTTVIASSNADAKVSLGEGTKRVALAVLAPSTTQLKTDWRTALNLGNVDNTSDASKPVSTAAQTALNLKLNAANPSFTGTAVGDNITLNNNLTATGQVSSGGGYGFKVNGYIADGSNWYTAGLLVDPAYGQSMNLHGYHVPGSWAGMRMVLGSTSPGVIEFRQGGGGQIFAAGVQLTSDIRTKINIKPITGVLDRLDDFQAVEFDRLLPSLDGSLVHEAGAIAQWLERSFPFLVTRDAPTEDDPDPIRRVNYSGMAAVALQGAKEVRDELRDEVRSQAELIKQLMQRLEALEARA